jgi:hypothetical protein
MLGVQDLVDTTSSAWPLVQSWIRDAVVPVEVLPREGAHAESTLVDLQVTTRSPLGAVAYETGGVSVLNGWLRVLGSGSGRMNGSLSGWNGLDGKLLLPDLKGLLIIGHDVLGGVFALDGGALGPGKGGAFYFAPDSLDWQDLERGYSDFLNFVLTGNLKSFYADYFWPSWERDVAELSLDQGLSQYPPLYTVEGKDLSKVSRRPVPMMELFAFELDCAKQLAQPPK